SVPSGRQPGECDQPVERLFRVDRVVRDEIRAEGGRRHGNRADAALRHRAVRRLDGLACALALARTALGPVAAAPPSGSTAGAHASNKEVANMAMKRSATKSSVTASIGPKESGAPRRASIEISVAHGAPAQERADVLVVGAFTDGTLTPGGRAGDEACGGRLRKVDRKSVV